MIDAIGFALLGILYLIASYVAYRIKWPEGVLPPPPEPDEYARIRRVGRRRVRPLPERRPREVLP